MTTQSQLQTYGDIISCIMQTSPSLRLFNDREFSRKAAKRLQAQLRQDLFVFEQEYTVSGVNFSRIQVDAICRDYKAGKLIEFETVGPYLADYLQSGGRMTMRNLSVEDMIGVHLAALFRSIFPKARLVALCDEYNGRSWDAASYPEADLPQYSQIQKQVFFESFVKVLTDAAAVPADAQAEREYLLLAESAYAGLAAKKLIAVLERAGHIEYTNGAVYFVNPDAENPLHRRFCLRNARGRWLCETLEAAGFLHSDNKNVTHLVVLPDYMKDQQDRVWEILRILGIRPLQHHNIFFDPKWPVGDIVGAIARVFSGETKAKLDK